MDFYKKFVILKSILLNIQVACILLSASFAFMYCYKQFEYYTIAVVSTLQIIRIHSFQIDCIGSGKTLPENLQCVMFLCR